MALFETYLYHYFADFDPHIWRKKHLWKEDCDLTIKCLYRTFQKLFEKLISKNLKNLKTITLTEFADLIAESGALNETLTRGEIYPLWNLSMMTQIDEINSDKHL